MKNIKDLIKRCPICKTIWIKTEGCTNVTCGKKISEKDNLYLKKV
jgi:hypothetical protein